MVYESVLIKYPFLALVNNKFFSAILRVVYCKLIILGNLSNFYFKTQCEPDGTSKPTYKIRQLSLKEAVFIYKGNYAT